MTGLAVRKTPLARLKHVRRAINKYKYVTLLAKTGTLRIDQSLISDQKIDDRHNPLFSFYYCTYSTTNLI